jgi:outer membrane protein assembly factor BamB
MFRGTPQRTGKAEAAPALPWTLAWTASASAAHTSPALSQDLVFCTGSGVTALDKTTGERRWRQAQAAFSPWSSPALADGLLYVASRAVTVTALDAQHGTLAWQVTEAGESGITASPLAVGGKVFVATQGGRLLAFDGKSGNPLWRTAIGHSVSSPAADGDTVFVGSREGLFAVAADTGKLRWWADLPRGVDTSPAVAQGTVYAGGRDGCVYALAADSGEIRWRQPVSKQWLHSSPLVTADSVIVGTLDGEVVALDRTTGARKWATKLGGSVYSSPVLAGDRVLVGSRDCALYALSLTGEIVWRFQTRGYAHSTPAVDDSGVYFASGDGTLYAFTTVRDDLAIPRGELVKAVADAVGLRKCPEVPEKLWFQRVPEADPNYAAIEAAVSHCLIGELSQAVDRGGERWRRAVFEDPTEPLPRQEFAAFLEKLLWTFAPLGILIPPFQEAQLGDAFPAWLGRVPHKIVGCGLLKAKPGNQFGGRDPVTYGEARQACELLRQWAADAPANRNYSLLNRLTELIRDGEPRDRAHFQTRLRYLTRLQR